MSLQGALHLHGFLSLPFLRASLQRLHASAVTALPTAHPRPWRRRKLGIADGAPVVDSLFSLGGPDTVMAAALDELEQRNKKLEMENNRLHVEAVSWQGLGTLRGVRCKGCTQPKSSPLQLLV